jgi:hypothetical protein
MRSSNQAQARRDRAMAGQLRQQAEAAIDPVIRQQLLELVGEYDRRADEVERESRTKKPG